MSLGIIVGNVVRWDDGPSTPMINPSALSSSCMLFDNDTPPMINPSALSSRCMFFDNDTLLMTFGLHSRSVCHVMSLGIASRKSERE